VTHLGYLLVGWGVSLSVVGLYSLSLVRRGRHLAARVPAERQRWMTTEMPPK